MPVRVRSICRLLCFWRFASSDVTSCSMFCFNGYTAKSTENTPAAWPPAARNAPPSPPKKSASLAYSRFLSTRCINGPATSDRALPPQPPHFERNTRTNVRPLSLRAHSARRTLFCFPRSGYLNFQLECNGRLSNGFGLVHLSSGRKCPRESQWRVGFPWHAHARRHHLREP